jgi:hypothetical protein
MSDRYDRAVEFLNSAQVAELLDNPTQTAGFSHYGCGIPGPEECWRCLKDTDPDTELTSTGLCAGCHQWLTENTDTDPTDKHDPRNAFDRYRQTPPLDGRGTQ